VIAPRGLGRPQVRSDDETRQVIVEAAARTFESQGYAAANIADIAEAAGVSTKTLYRLVPTKAALFESFVADRIDRFVLEVDHDACATCDALAVVENLLLSHGRFVLEERTVAINRLLLTGRRPLSRVDHLFLQAGGSTHEGGDRQRARRLALSWADRHR
jgi:AcrR family transcriptional regulator